MNVNMMTVDDVVRHLYDLFHDRQWFLCAGAGDDCVHIYCRIDPPVIIPTTIDNIDIKIHVVGNVISA